MISERCYYWIWATAIDPEAPLMIGEWIDAEWVINGYRFTAGTGITAIHKINRPRSLPVEVKTTIKRRLRKKAVATR